MNEIKIENNLNVVCHGCLSSDRGTVSLGVFSEMFLNLIGNQKQTMIYAVEDVKFCWECMAVLRKFKSFQNQLRNAQTVLMQMLYDLDFSPVSLSKLRIIKRHYYNHEYIHSGKTKQNKNTFLNTEELKDNDNANLVTNSIDSIKEENYSEFDYIDDNADQNDMTNDKSELLYNDINVITDIYQNDIYQNALNNDSELQIDVESKKETLKKRKLVKPRDESLNINSNDIYQTDINNDEVQTGVTTKKVRAKRRKLVKSRDNSACYYKQYATLIERKKIDWGKVDDYFTMITFGEAEMEEHFLHQDRKFSMYSRFKYKCAPCELGYLRNFDLKRHNNLNHCKKAEWKCLLCQKRLDSLEELERHWREHTPIARCNLCGEVCRPRGKKNHLNFAHTKKYACQFCHLKFGKLVHFSRHYKEMHQKYICDYCHVCCKSKTLIQKHIRTNHTKFTCKACDREYPNYRQYKRHNSELHPSLVAERPELAYCVECDKQYPSVTKYKKHLKISPKHAEIKRYMLPCPDCGKIFKRKNYLNNHYNLYHAKKSKHYCELCDKYFANGYGLRKHRAYVHLKVSRVKDKMCDLCGRGFATNRILLNHRRTHTGERPYQCPCCSAAFTQKQAMQSHCRTQHKDLK